MNLLSMVKRVPGINRLGARRFTWRTVRRVLIGLSALATLIAIFYTVENWRGQRAWENCQRELAAKGEVIAWSAYLPPLVPDDQNIFKAPKMQAWFVRHGENEFSQNRIVGPPPKSDGLPKARAWFVSSGENELQQHLNVGTPSNLVDVAAIIAELALGSSRTDSDAEKADAVLQLGDPSAAGEAEKLIHRVLGPSAKGCQGGFTFVTRPLDQIKPARVVLQANARPTDQDLIKLFSGSEEASMGLNASLLQVKPAGNNSFEIGLRQPPCPAADYLALTDKLETDFDLIRKALQRPYARMEGNYQQPFAVPIQNFVCIRSLAQTLAQRAQCHLLLGQPEKALRDLTLLQAIRPLLEGAPAGKLTTLVAAMIEVAITGLYVDTIADGLRLQAWQAPQLAALQQQLQKINLPGEVTLALECDRAGLCRLFEITRTADLGTFFPFNYWIRLNAPTLVQTIMKPLSWCYTLVPRGWVYQNLTATAMFYQSMIDTFDLANNLVRPDQMDALDRKRKELKRHPYTTMAAIAGPHYRQALQTFVRNQTRVNEAFIACALERFRLARGQYPESLDALVPPFLDKLPHDIVGGQPLKYRRTDGGKFLLYSVGWNATDNGGQAAWNQDGTLSLDRGDWVWPVPGR